MFLVFEQLLPFLMGGNTFTCEETLVHGGNQHGRAGDDTAD